MSDTTEEIVSRAHSETLAAMTFEISLLREVLVFADGRSVAGGYSLSDLYAADSEKQGVLRRAGCHPRSVETRCDCGGKQRRAADGYLVCTRCHVSS